MKVLFCASECAPIAKVGGLGDVIESLPKALSGFGLEPNIALPYYDQLEKYQPTDTNQIVTIQTAQGPKDWQIFAMTLPGTSLPVLLFRNEIITGSGVYGSPNDNLRFANFSAAVAAHVQSAEYDVVHCHDWHTALVATLLKDHHVPTILTIHNVHPRAELDQIKREELRNLGVDQSTLVATSDDLPDSVSLLAQGVKDANFITTVSVTHAKEIQTAEFGGSLASLFRDRQQDLEGVVNGIDTDIFNPATDKNIASNYSSDDLSGKGSCRADLESIFGFTENPSPLVGVVTRLDEQKGIDIILGALPSIAQQGARVVILGTGDEHIEKQLAEANEKFPNNLKVKIEFDAALAQKIYAGADMFMMPSRFEPCGLGQIIAMRYGTLPIVRRTGGLADTVTDGTTGFVFDGQSGDDLAACYKIAAQTFADKNKWQGMQKTAMTTDFSWSKSAKEYSRIYAKISS